MKVTNKEELLVQELHTFCYEQKLALDGMLFFGRSMQKIKQFKGNDPMTVMLNHVEACARCLRSFSFFIYTPKNVPALFLEYESVRYGEYPNVDPVTEKRIRCILNRFYADYICHLTAIDSIITIESKDSKNKIFLPDDLQIEKIISNLSRIISEYCDS